MFDPAIGKLTSFIFLSEIRAYQTSSLSLLLRYAIEP